MPLAMHTHSSMSRPAVHAGHALVNNGLNKHALLLLLPLLPPLLLWLLLCACCPA